MVICKANNFTDGWCGMDHVELGILLDFYGPLLTKRQLCIMEQTVNEDCSLSEIAEREGISRQGVRDALRKAEEQLRFYEQRMRVAGRFGEISAILESIEKNIAHIPTGQRENIERDLSRIRRILEE